MNFSQSALFFDLSFQFVILHLLIILYHSAAHYSIPYGVQAVPDFHTQFIPENVYKMCTKVEQ